MTTEKHKLRVGHRSDAPSYTLAQCGCTPWPSVSATNKSAYRMSSVRHRELNDNERRTKGRH